MCMTTNFHTAAFIVDYARMGDKPNEKCDGRQEEEEKKEGGEKEGERDIELHKCL